MYALVTGATSGIGKEISYLLAKRGYSLLLTGRREERLIKIKERIQSLYPVDVVYMKADLCEEKDLLALIERAKTLPISVLINNAGFGKLGSFETLPLSQEKEMIQTNIIALHTLLKWFVQTHQEGYVLNVASIAAYQPSPMMATYGATKAYVLSLSQAVRYECQRTGKKISISTLCPGPVHTEFDQVAGSHFNMPSLSVEACASIAVKGLLKGKREIIPSIPTKLARFGSRLAPMAWILPIEYWVQMSKKRT